jgi:hypothetical protein
MDQSSWAKTRKNPDEKSVKAKRKHWVVHYMPSNVVVLYSKPSTTNKQIIKLRKSVI